MQEECEFTVNPIALLVKEMLLQSSGHGFSHGKIFLHIEFNNHWHHLFLL